MMIFSLIPNVYAMSPAPGGTNDSGMIQMVMFGAVFLIFFMLVIRPQSKKAKRHKELVAELKKGDRVISSAGIFGVVNKVFDEKDYILLEIAEKTIVKIKKDNIATVSDSNKKPEKEKKSKSKPVFGFCQPSYRLFRSSIC